MFAKYTSIWRASLESETASSSTRGNWSPALYIPPFFVVYCCFGEGLRGRWRIPPFVVVVVVVCFFLLGGI